MKLKIDLFMWLKSIKANKGYYIYLLIVACIFYAMNCYTPLYSDDWHYNFIYGTNKDINSFYDILYSQYIHYFQVNGRFIPHVFVQLFDGILGKQMFNVINTFVFVAYLCLLSYTIQPNNVLCYKLVSFILFLTFLLTGFSNSLLWMSGACNYLWVAVLLLLFNLLFNKNIVNKLLLPILFFFGIICGWTNEALVVGLGVGYFIYLIYNRKKVSISQIVLLLGFYLGALMLVFSPGSINRASLSAGDVFSVWETFKSYLSALIAMNNLRIMFLLLLLLFIGGYNNWDKLKMFLMQNYVLFIAIIVSFVLVLLTKHDSPHSRFGIELFSLILICRWVGDNLNYYMSHILNLITITICIFSLGYMSKAYMDYKNVIQQITIGRNKVIQTNKVIHPHFFDKYIINTDFYTTTSSKWVANHFKTDDLIFLPEKFVEDVCENPGNYNEFYTFDDLWFYAKKVAEDIPFGKVTFLLVPYDSNNIPFYVRPWASKIQRYSIPSVDADFNIVNFNGMKFIIVKKNMMIDDRVRDIVIL